MARYILDIANVTDTKAKLNEIVEQLGNDTVSVVCIDETNEAQFWDDPTKNELTEQQSQTYSDYCHREE